MDDWIRRIREHIGNDLMFINSAGGWVEGDQGRVLLQLRSAAYQEWGFPGGVMALGESAEEAAVREIREETGLNVEATALIGVYSKYFKELANGHQCQTITIMFRMRIVGGALTVDNQETFDLKFFDPRRLPPLFSRQYRDIVTDVLEQRIPAFR